MRWSDYPSAKLQEHQTGIRVTKASLEVMLNVVHLLKSYKHNVVRHLLVTVRRKMFAINNFREFREWSTFANIIIRELLCSRYMVYIYLCTHYYNYGGVTLRWRTSMEALCLVKPSSGRSSMGS